MELSSDTIRSASVAISSVLRHEELDDTFAIDWWFDAEVSENKPSRAERKRLAVVEPVSPSKDASALTRTDVENIVSTQMTSLRDDLIEAATPRALRPKWWNTPIGGGILGGLAVAVIWGIVSGIASHSSKDSATQIADEITNQLNRRSAADAENLDNRIAAEVGKALMPIHQEITGMNEDIGNIKDHLGIAQNAAPKLRIPSVGAEDSWANKAVALSAISPREFEKNLATLTVIFQHLQDEGTVLAPRTVQAIQTRLIKVPTRNTDYWKASAAAINYISFVREHSGFFPNADLARASTCRFPFNGSGIVLDRSSMSGPSMELDGKTLVDSYFVNCILIYHGGEIHLRNVTFRNCLFVWALPGEPAQPAQQLTESVLSATAGHQPTVSINAG